MALDHPVIITGSISGALADRDQCPAIPYTPAEYAAEARRIVDEGGVHIHIHARRPDGRPSYEVEDFQAISQAIRQEVDRRRDPQLLHRGDGRLRGEARAYLRACRHEVAALNIGISRPQWMLVAAALTLGGSVRVGLEDNLYLPDGTMARSNGELIAKARQMTEDVGRRPATVAEARRLLALPERSAA